MSQSNMRILHTSKHIVIVYSLYLFVYSHCYLFRQLKDQTCQVANAFKAQGIKKGDRVVIYMPMIPLAVSVMLACARIGAIHRYSVHYSGTCL